MLRPLDIVVLLKLSLIKGQRPSFQRIAVDLHVYPAEVHTSVKRARISGLIYSAQLKDQVNRTALLEFLIHGLRYAFPPELGAPTRGVPTAYAAPPLRTLLPSGDEIPPVWPYAKGKVRGYSFKPLHKSVPQIALEDHDLYELLALVDAIREGRARERNLAVKELTQRVASPTHD